MNLKFGLFLLLMNAAVVFAISCNEVKKNIHVTLCKDNNHGDATVLAIKDEPCTQEMFQYICSITSLKQLQLKHTELYYIPQEITNLKKLNKLDVNGNRFSDFSNVLKLTNLENLIVTDNCISCDDKPKIKGAVTVCNSDKSADEKCEWEGCGPLFNGHKCSNNLCCSKEGICGKREAFCSSLKGCQSKYGQCKCSGKYGSCMAGECCSAKGYCGKTSSYCSTDKGCQHDFGDCRCGTQFGSCKAGECCSKYGYCGKTSSYCSTDKGCQHDFGDCRCGTQFGSCKAGECCSKYGYCGKTSSYCSGDKGCQQDFGDCKCGTQFGKCPNNGCCSKKGYCGRKANYCYSERGCQKKYGECKCGEGKGSCESDFCCSRKGYCGVTEAYCSIDKGCQMNYGKCSPDTNIDDNQDYNCPKDIEEEKEVEVEGKGNQDFDFSFLKLENNKKNMAYSPLSIKYALHMLQEGAVCNTFTEINKVVGNEDLPKYTSIEKVLSFANGSFIKDIDFKKIKTEYINTLKTKYEAEVKQDELKDPKNVNKWIEEKTFGIIKDMLKDDDIDYETVLLLINALAINMEWIEGFDKEDVTGRSFYKDNGEEIIATTLIHYETFGCDIGYYKDDDTTVLTKDLKDYDGIQLEFMAIMPKEDLSSFVNNISKEQISHFDKNLKLACNTRYGVNVKIPKFKFTYDLNFKEDLMNLGIKDAFNKTKAQFSKISDKKELYVSKAFHKADIEFSEDGIKAAAVTVIEMGPKSVMPEEETKPINIIIDKPFMFIIRDKTTKDIWFTGTVYEPNLWENDEDLYIEHGIPYIEGEPEGEGELENEGEPENYE